MERSASKQEEEEREIRRSERRFKKNRGGKREKCKGRQAYCKGYNVSGAVNGEEERGSRGRKTGSTRREERCAVPKREKKTGGERGDSVHGI